MGTTICCETIRQEKSEVDLSVARRVASDLRSKSANYQYTKSLSKGSRGSKMNLQIKLQEIGIDPIGSSQHLELLPAKNKSRSGIASGAELYPVHSSNEFSISNVSPQSPKQQANYIVVVEANEEQERRDSDDGDGSKSRSYCRSLEKSIEEKAIAAARHQAAHLGTDGQFKNSDGMLSNSVVHHKPEKSIMQSKYNIEDLPSGRTIEQTLAGKTKDTLIVSGATELANIDRFSDSKFVKSYIHLKEFSDSMVKKFINATSVLSSQYTEVVLVL